MEMPYGVELFFFDLKRFQRKHVVLKLYQLVTVVTKRTDNVT